MKKLPTTPEKNLTDAINVSDYHLPRITISHKSVPIIKSHAMGESHTMTVKAKKISQNEKESTYKITHIGAKPQPKTKTYMLAPKGYTGKNYSSMESETI